MKKRLRENLRVLKIDRPLRSRSITSDNSYSNDPEAAQDSIQRRPTLTDENTHQLIEVIDDKERNSPVKMSEHQHSSPKVSVVTRARFNSIEHKPNDYN